ncbi:unnamed protein product [Lymnaea stagnalis]|uniref:Chitin-binding type-2 domain-containing protein n=1 Tax=Lymnaea stagnalis TaxID=6523 RepID=A0AAV2H0V5_LYMST
MEDRTIFTIITVAIVSQCILANVEYLSGDKREYNALCPNSTRYAVVSLPPQLCDARGYIMCWEGVAKAINRCGINERFNNATGWCDAASNVPLPSGCVNNQTANRYPVSCLEQGATYVAMNSTCKKYTLCMPGGYNYTMTCPLPSYFVPAKERCIYAFAPFLDDIPPETFADCQAKDAYTAEQLRSGRR